MIDVCPVEVEPAVRREGLPAGTRLLGTHPLFGPNGGRDGIAGLKAVVCDEGRDAAATARSLRLDVRRATPEAHDREVACVQGPGHLVAGSLEALNLPDFALAPASYARLGGLVGPVEDGPAARFDAAVKGDSSAPEVPARFVEAARALVDRASVDPALTCDGAG